jgi:hypothetical protein
MRVFAIRIERPLNVSVQCPQDADARHHGGPAELDDQEQGFDRGLPLLEQLFGLRKLLDIVRGVPQGDELATVGEWNRIIERPRFQPRSATAPRGADVGASMIAGGAKHPGLQISKGHVVGKAASVDLSVVVTVRIAAVDEYVVTPEVSHIRERNGFVMKQEVRDRPRHP